MGSLFCIVRGRRDRQQSECVEVDLRLRAPGPIERPVGSGRDTMPAMETVDPRLRRTWWLTRVLGVLLVFGFWLHSRAWVFLCDDAFISFRYAVNLAHHGALEYNLGERVEGYTNFLWVLALVPGLFFDVWPDEVAPVLSVIGAGMLVVVSMLLLRGLRGRSGQPWQPADLVPAALMIASPEIMVWSQGGLETSTAAALAVAAMAAWIARKPMLAAVLAGLAGLTRADVLIGVAVFGIAWLLTTVRPSHLRQTQKNPNKNPNENPAERALKASTSNLGASALIKPAAVFVALVGGHLIFRRLYYGAWVPNTWLIKSHGALLRETHGVPYLLAWLEAIGLREPMMAALLLLIRVRHLVLALPIAALAIYVWSVGGDFMAYSRFLVLASALVAVLVGWLLADLGEILGKRWPRLAAVGWLLGLLLAGLLAMRAHGRFVVDQATSEGWIDGRFEGVRAMDHFATERLHVGTWMRIHLPPDTLITVGAAGAMPYISELPTIDVYGLVDPAIAKLPGIKPARGIRARPGHQIAAPRSYLLERDPDLFCHVGYVGPRRPSAASARRRGLGPNVVWACVEPEPLGSSREPSGRIGVNYYCCLRPRNRPVGPFGND